MLSLELVDYCHIDKIQEFMNAINQSGEVFCGTGMLMNFQDDLTKYIQVEKKIHLGISEDSSLVPGTTLVCLENDEVVGFVNIRHCLNEFLLAKGGHIGYSVHPMHRKKGYGTWMLNKAIDYCKQKDIYPILVTCDKDNIGSRRVIEANKGKLETEGVTLRYWIGKENERL
ncbi:GNAT family N-acetyltransferase [Tannockella kyphosi]|uniref:GNAT family N-acetyltransferase n=1 Tax=Tannockella kyphosi TaxID=2899121 RepID=UPI0020131D5E|nr:GNAT family N-acetyltransferase [Tannockella kyphosi]